MGRDNIATYGTKKIYNGNTRSAMQEKRRAGRVFGLTGKRDPLKTTIVIWGREK